MNNKEFIKFAEETIKIATVYARNYLGPVPDYKIIFRPIQGNERNDAPCNIEGLGLFVFFKEGIRQRFTIPLREKEMRIYTSGSWLQGLIHELVHIYEEVPFQKIYKTQKRRQKYFGMYRYWIDGLAEYFAWKVVINLYKKAKNEENFWKKRKRLEDITKALKEKKYKLGIRQRLVHLGVFNYFVHKNKGLEKYFTLPKSLPKEIKKEIDLSIKNKKLSFTLPPYAENYFKRVIKGEEKITDLYSQYAIGLTCTLRIIKNKNDFKKLLNNPKSNKELMRLAKIY